MNESKKSWPRRFFGLIWGTLVLAYRLVLTLLVLGLVVGVWMAMRGGMPKPVEDNVALVIWPSGELVDQANRDPGTAFLEDLSGEQPSQTLLRDLTDALERGAADPRIALAVLRLDQLGSTGMAQMQELAAAMQTFRSAGKPIWVQAAYFDQMGYYAAAHADHVLLDPQGMVGIEGFSSYGPYFKEALDKLGVEVNVFRVGEYKSAVEPFLRNDMSPEARAANLDWLGDLWGHYVSEVSSARGLAPDAASRYVDGLVNHMVETRGDAAAVARDAGLVTGLATLDEFRAQVAETVGFDDDHGSFRQIHYRDYLRSVQHGEGPQPASTNEVALVAVQGEIVDGDGQVGQAGGDRIAALLSDLRREDSIRAVVLRVNSPGGSAWASEQIRRQVQQLRAAGKPVVVSMGNVAASGGYWVSMDADQIWAQPTTITGSIGIFGLIPTIDRPLAKLGIHTDGVGTTSLAGAMRLDRPLSAPVKAMMQAMIEHGYHQFIEGVAGGRKLSVEQVEQLARGRVWSGADALDLGLVDQLGGLDDALEAAAQLAGIPEGEWALRDAQPEDDSPLHFLSRFMGQSGMGRGLGLGWLPDSFSLRLVQWLDQRVQLADLPAFRDPRGVYAHCLCVPQTGSSRGLQN